MNHLDLASDDVLLGVVSEVINEADPVTERAVAAAKAMVRLSEVDAELANLVADSLVDDGVVLRHDVTLEPLGNPSDRLVSFATPQLTVDLDLHADGATVVGAITPPISTDVELETPDGRQATRSDELGRFHFSAGPGRVRLRVQAYDGAVVTPWITR